MGLPRTSYELDNPKNGVFTGKGDNELVLILHRESQAFFGNAAMQALQDLTGHTHIGAGYWGHSHGDFSLPAVGVDAMLL
jgi:hypothetical protein